MAGYWERDVTWDDVIKVAAEINEAYRGSGAVQRPDEFFLADRAEHLYRGLLYPSMAPTPQAPVPAGALAWLVRDCADDEHAAYWLESRLRRWGLTSADVVRQADPDGTGLPGLAAFGPIKEQYSLVLLDRLPMTRPMFRCRHLDPGAASRKRTRWAVPTARRRPGTPAGADRPCPSWGYGTPRVDWEAVGRGVVDLFNDVPADQWSEETVVRWAKENTGPGVAALVAEQFRDPIRVARLTGLGVNGHHRVAQFRAAGLTHVVVRTV